MSTMNEAASTADDLGSVDRDVAPGAEPLVDSSPATAAAAAAASAAAAPAVVAVAAVAVDDGAGGVEGVSAANDREGTRDPLKHLFSAENLSKHHVWNNTNGCVYEYVRL